MCSCYLQEVALTQLGTSIPTLNVLPTLACIYIPCDVYKVPIGGWRGQGGGRRRSLAMFHPSWVGGAHSPKVLRECHDP